MKAAAYRLSVLDGCTAPLVVSSFFPPRHRSTLRLAGTRYSRVTVKLSVLLTQPRIWGDPSTVRSSAIDPCPILERETGRPPPTSEYGARKDIFLLFVDALASSSYVKSRSHKMLSKCYKISHKISTCRIFRNGGVIYYYTLICCNNILYKC